MTNRIKNIDELHGLSIKDAARMPEAFLLFKWEQKGLYRVDADKGVFIVPTFGQPRIKTGQHKDRVDLNALRG